MAWALQAPKPTDRARRWRCCARTATSSAGSLGATRSAPTTPTTPLQRASLILLTKAPPIDPGRLIAWMVVVTKHEAMAVRRGRERLLAALAPAHGGDGRLNGAPSELPGPGERLERLSEARAALAALKANERLAIVLQAQGYSYAEICERCGWTYTKVNRCLAEGRARLRSAALT